MTALITGGSGFIAAELARRLLAEGEAEPVLFDIRPLTSRLQDVADQVEFVQGDLGNFRHVLDAVKAARPEIIYHLGAMLSVPCEADPPAALRANALGTFHVLEAARLFEVRQVVFSSTLATYGQDIREEVLTDHTLQRPVFFYGATKLFAESMGYFYRRKYGLDFRGIRFPSVCGPGSRTPAVSQYIPWMIEESARGNPFTVNVEERTRLPFVYFKDAARALMELQQAPRESIKTVVYIFAGIKPALSAGELADLVRGKAPGARIEFKPDPELQAAFDQYLLPIDDSNARAEWGWKIEYDAERMVDDFLLELREHPQRYA